MPTMAAESSSGALRARMKARPAGIGLSSFFRKRTLSFFVYGFAKSEQGNIDESDERDFRDLAITILAVSDAELKNLPIAAITRR